MPSTGPFLKKATSRGPIKPGFFSKYFQKVHTEDDDLLEKIQNDIYKSIQLQQDSHVTFTNDRNMFAYDQEDHFEPIFFGLNLTKKPELISFLAATLLTSGVVAALLYDLIYLREARRSVPTAVLVGFVLLTFFQLGFQIFNKTHVIMETSARLFWTVISLSLIMISVCLFCFLSVYEFYFSWGLILGGTLIVISTAPSSSVRKEADKLNKLLFDAPKIEDYEQQEPGKFNKWFQNTFSCFTRKRKGHATNSISPEHVSRHWFSSPPIYVHYTEMLGNNEWKIAVFKGARLFCGTICLFAVCASIIFGMYLPIAIALLSQSCSRATGLYKKHKIFVICGFAASCLVLSLLTQLPLLLVFSYQSNIGTNTDLVTIAQNELQTGVFGYIDEYSISNYSVGSLQTSGGFGVYVDMEVNNILL